MSGRHARTNHPPSTDGTLIERALRRPARLVVVGLIGLALAAPMVVAAQPADTDSVSSEAAVSTPRASSFDQEVVETVGASAHLVSTYSTASANDHLTYLSASIILARQDAVREAAAREQRRIDDERAQEQRRIEQQARAEQAREAPEASPSVASGSVWDSLAQCESGGNWAINTGNGYYGGLQFSLSSWRGVGGVGYPHEASRETQIAMGERLKGSGGWGHWPACSRKLGLR